jgi:hypothetical protein
MNQSKKKA